jgi:hypothetical protein
MCIIIIIIIIKIIIIIIIIMDSNQIQYWKKNISCRLFDTEMNETDAFT